MSADPNLFGSIKRRKEKAELADTFTGRAADVEGDIKQVQAVNPFESAAAKSAMKRASRGAKAMQTRTLNVLGAGASPEALIAAQGATGEALGSAAGQIATGAEAMKGREVSELRRLKAGYEGQAAGIKQSSIEERGSGWRDAFSLLDTVAGGVGGAISAIPAG